jgi:hypothetical protein
MVRSAVLAVVAALTLGAAEPAPPSILLIGDSNTEGSWYSGAMRRQLAERHGAIGTGYIPLFPTVDGQERLRFDHVVPYPGHPRPFAISYEPKGSWEQFDMYHDNRRLDPPHLAPNGMWIRNRQPGAAVVLDVEGRSFELFWLADKDGGEIEIQVDGATKATVATAGPRQVRTTAVSGLAVGRHAIRLNARSGSSTLLGIDIRAAADASAPCASVHNWGNAWATTKDFLDIDETVFASGLKAVAARTTVIMLGTNDVGLDRRGRPDIERNLTAIVQRITAATPKTRIVLASCFSNMDGGSMLFTGLYWRPARAAGIAHIDTGHFTETTGANMYTMLHFDDPTGSKVGAELLAAIAHREAGGAPIDPDNLLLNPGFEDGGPGGWNVGDEWAWRSGQIRYCDAKAPRSGRYAATLPGGNWNRLGQKVDLAASTRYRFAIAVQAEGGRAEIELKGWNGPDSSTVLAPTGTGSYEVLSHEFTTGTVTPLSLIHI